MANIKDSDVSEAGFGVFNSTKEHLKRLRDNSNFSEELKQVERSYRAGADDFYNGISRVRVPALHQAVEIVTPKMDKVLFPPDGEFLGVQPKDKSDDLAVDNAEAVKALIKQQFKDANVRSKLIPLYRDLCIYGTVFVKTFWDKRVVERHKRVDGKREKVFDVVFDNPDFYSPNIWDMYVDPKDENLEDWVIEKIPVNYSDLWDLRKRNEDGEEVGIYDQNKLVEMRNVNVMQDTDDTEKHDSEERTGLSSHTYGPHDHKLFLWQTWGPVPKWLITKNSKDKEEKTVVKNALIECVTNENGHGVFLRALDNPFDHGEKPYLKGTYLKQSNRSYGIGLIAPNIPLEAELNTVRNQNIDARSFNLKKKYIVSREANVTESELQDVHNKIIYTDLMNGIREVPFTDISASAGVQMEQIQRDIEDSTGASKLLGGTPTGSSLDRTAAGVATVVQSGLERFELVVTQFQEDVMKPLIRHFWMLDQQFLPDGRDLAVTGKGITKVLPENININEQELNFLGVREIGEKGFKINALNILLQNLSPFIPMGLDPIPVVMRFFKLAGMGDLAQEVDKRPETQAEDTPEGEVQLLRLGRDVKINLNDDHNNYLTVYEQEFLGRQLDQDPVSEPEAYVTEFRQLLGQSQEPDNVKNNLIEAVGQRLIALRIQSTGFAPGRDDIGNA